MTETSQRKIIHVDMDAFYTSVEQMDNPNLKGKPVAVGGNKEYGVVAAASYEARKYGVRSATASKIAAIKCPGLIFIKPRFSRYKEISQQIRRIFHDYTDLVEPLSLDEAYLDVTENKKKNPSATLLATDIRERIYKEVGMTASAGISLNKFIAKIASDINKPNGQKTIKPNEIESFLEGLPIGKFYGIGKITTERMNKLGIVFGKDLKLKSREFLFENFNNSGLHYYAIVRGIHNSPVEPHRIRKSIATEHTYFEGISSEIKMLEKLDEIAKELERRMKISDTKGKTITLKIKYRDFKIQTRSKTVVKNVNKKREFFPVVERLLHQSPLKDSIRLLGIGISNLDSDEQKEMSVQLKFDFSY